MFPSAKGGSSISWADFQAYYKQIAVLIPEDTYFEKFIEGQYRKSLRHLSTN